MLKSALTRWHAQRIRAATSHYVGGAVRLDPQGNVVRVDSTAQLGVTDFFVVPPAGTRGAAHESRARFQVTQPTTIQGRS